MTSKRRTITPRGVAGILARGIRANFAPENWVSETDKLVEFLLDLAMARGSEEEIGSAQSWFNSNRDVAKSDAEWLDAIASDLASTTVTQDPGK